MRIGIFGGTFDPVHDGHVNPVARAAERFGLARVIWIPARVSPLKGAPPTDARHRVAMVALAIDGRPDWVLSFDELDREPFVGQGLAIPEVAGLQNRLEVFDGGSFKISATDLRTDLARGGSPAGRVPGPVAEYITKHRLYRGVEG